MRRLLTASVPLAVALLATAAAGQPPPAKTDPPAKMPDKKADKKVPDPTETAIAAALANDPDVKMARAKIQLAEAELAKARAAVTLKVVTLKSKIAQYKTEVATAQDSVAQMTRQVQGGVVSTAELVPVRARLEAAQGALALAEAELKLLTGGSTGDTGAGTADPGSANQTAQALAWLMTHQSDPGAAHASALALLAADRFRERAAVKGPVPDRLRAALDRPVKLGAKGERVTIEKALEVFKKEAGLDVPVRGLLAPAQGKAGSFDIESQGEEMSVGAWFQLFEDNALVRLSTGAMKYQFYVREYGLLVSTRESAPTDAPTLTEFWKQKPPAREPDPKK